VWSGLRLRDHAFDSTAQQFWPTCSHLYVCVTKKYYFLLVQKCKDDKMYFENWKDKVSQPYTTEDHEIEAVATPVCRGG